MSRSRVLVIDDSPTIRKLVELSLRGEAYVIDQARTGQEGIDKALHEPPDVILLDYLLPDMKGTDVCRSLSRDPRASSIPIVVMSANGRDVRELFRGFSQVVDFAGKPFAPGDMVARIHKVCAAAEAATPAPASMRPSAAETPAPRPAQKAREIDGLLSFAQLDAAAKAVYAELRPALGRIPSWMPELGATSPASFFARKLLTPTLMSDLLDALLPTFRAVLGASAAAPSPDAPAGAARLEGELSGFSMLRLLRMLDASRTGVLTLSQGAQRVLVYVRDGEIVLVTTDDPAHYLLRASSIDVSAVRPEALASAREEQRRSGKPLYLGLADAGEIDRTAAIEAVHRLSLRLLMEAVNAPSARFAWREGRSLPDFVDVCARRLPLAQIELERLRADPDTLEPALSIDTVLTRSELFSQKVQDLDLSGEERRVLSVIDGRRPIEDLIRRSNLPAVRALPVLRRLLSVELLRRQVVRRASPAQEGRRVLIVEPAVEDFQRPLEALLKRRREPLVLVSLQSSAAVLSAVAREAPRMVIINADAPGAEAERSARLLRADPSCAQVRLVAVLELPSPGREGRLIDAGFDAVLTKPVSYPELEQLLVG